MTDLSLEDTTWVVTAVAGSAVEAGARNEVGFHDGRIVGQVGVNRFSGTYTIGEGRMTIGPIMSTMMAGLPEQMDLESKFHEAIEGEHPFWRDGQLLYIGDVTGGITLRQSGEED